MRLGDGSVGRDDPMLGLGGRRRRSRRGRSSGRGRGDGGRLHGGRTRLGRGCRSLGNGLAHDRRRGGGGGCRSRCRCWGWGWGRRFGGHLGGDGRLDCRLAHGDLGRYLGRGRHFGRDLGRGSLRRRRLLRSGLLDRLGLGGLLVADQTVLHGAPAHSIGLSLLDARRMALHTNSERDGKVERLLVGHAELFGKLVQADVLRHLAVSLSWYDERGGS